MPSANPFAPTFEVGGSAQAGPASAGGGFSLGNLTGGTLQDHHAVATYLLVGLAVLFLLHRAHFRFSSTVGG